MRAITFGIPPEADSSVRVDAVSRPSPRRMTVYGFTGPLFDRTMAVIESIHSGVLKQNATIEIDMDLQPFSEFQAGDDCDINPRNASPVSVELDGFLYLDVSPEDAPFFCWEGLSVGVHAQPFDEMRHRRTGTFPV